MHKLIKNTNINIDNDKIRIPIPSEINKPELKKKQESERDYSAEERALEEQRRHIQSKYEEEARRNAEEVLNEAYRVAEIIINHTLDGAKNELASVVEQGYMDGFNQGKAEAVSIIEPALSKIGKLFDIINRIQDEMLDDYKEKMFLIIAESIKKVIHKEINERDAYIFDLYNDAVKNIKIEDNLTVTVSERDISFVTKNKEMFLAETGKIDDFKIVTDINAKKGTLIIETTKSVIDASADVQIENIENLLQKLKNNLNIEEYKQNFAGEISAIYADNSLAGGYGGGTLNLSDESYDTDNM